MARDDDKIYAADMDDDRLDEKTVLESPGKEYDGDIQVLAAQDAEIGTQNIQA